MVHFTTMPFLPSVFGKSPTSESSKKKEKIDARKERRRKKKAKKTAEKYKAKKILDIEVEDEGDVVHILSDSDEDDGAAGGGAATTAAGKVSPSSALGKAPLSYDESKELTFTSDNYDPLLHEFTGMDVTTSFDHSNQYDAEMMKFEMEDINDLNKTKRKKSFEKGRLKALEAAVASGRIGMADLNASDKRALELLSSRRHTAKPHFRVASRAEQIKTEWNEQRKMDDMRQHKFEKTRVNYDKMVEEFNSPSPNRGSPVHKSAVLIQDIKSKNKLIDRLSAEVDKLTGSLKACGKEIIHLRQKTHQTEREKASLQHTIERSNQVTTSLRGPITWATVQQMPQSERPRFIVLLGEKLQQERQRNQVYTQKIKALRIILEKMVHRDKVHEQIRKAHLSSQVYIQQLQDDLKALPQLKSAVTSQEQTIKRLESMMEMQLLNAQRQKNIRDREEEVKIKKIEREVKEKFDQLEEEREAEKKKMKALGVMVPSPTKRGRGAVFQDTESVITSLKQEIAEKDIRIKTLEEQMVRNAQTFARESTGLKLKLQEQALEDGF